MNVYQNEKEMISIIVPVYNVEKYLQPCIDSILRQTYTNFELILIDDGSTDGSVEICKNAARQDSRIIVLHEVNAGVSAARNAGLNIARGEYIGFVDSDDWIAPDMYEQLMSTIRQHAVGCAMCGFVKTYEEDQIVYPSNKYRDENVFSENACAELCVSVGNRKMDFNFFVVWNKLYKRDIWERLRFDENLKSAEDRWALFHVYCAVEKIAVCPQMLYYYRQNEGLSSPNNKNHEFDYIVGYRMLEEARRRRWNVQPYIETVVVHTSGKIRSCIKNEQKEAYWSAYKEFKMLWCDIKDVLKSAKKVYLFFSIAFRYFPGIVWIIMNKIYRNKIGNLR